MSKISDEIKAMRVHFGFTDSQLKAGLVASVAATFLATMFGEWFPAVGWTAFSFNFLNGEAWATNFKNLAGFYPITQGTVLSPDFTYFLGMWAHYWQGIIFGLLFTLLVYPNLPGLMRTGNNILKGLLWGWTLFLVSSSFVMPLLYGTGFMFSHWGNDFGIGQTNLIFWNFTWHSVYGFILGVFYNPLPKAEAGMGTSETKTAGSWGSAAHWGQIVLGWIVVIIGGYVSSIGTKVSATDPRLFTVGGLAAWGIILGLIGLILVTGPSLSGRRKKA